MTDYIKREDIVDLGVMMQTHLWTREQTYNAIFCLPSADVAPVRHGKWEGCKGDITCSACGEYALYDSEDIEMQYRTLYCPFCGAKMGEGGTDGTDDR